MKVLNSVRLCGCDKLSLFLHKMVRVLNEHVPVFVTYSRQTKATRCSQVLVSHAGARLHYRHYGGQLNNYIFYLSNQCKQVVVFSPSLSRILGEPSNIHSRHVLFLKKILSGD